MKGRTLEEYKEMFKNTDKERIIEMNYEISKQLCELEEALLTIRNFLNRGEY